MTIIAMEVLISRCKRTYCFIILLLFELGVNQDITLQLGFKSSRIITAIVREI
jgi:hypothetical protein